MAETNLDIYSYAHCVPLTFFEAELKKDNKYRLKFLTDEKAKESIRVRLVNTLVAFYMDAQNHMLRGREEKLARRSSQLDKCCDLLLALDPENKEKSRHCPLGYLGLHAYLDLSSPKTDPENAKSVQTLIEDVKYFTTQVKALYTDPTDLTDEIRQGLTQFNELRRQHWAIGMTMGELTLDLVLEQHAYRAPHHTQFQSSKATLDVPFGYLSFFILFLRFGLEIGDAIRQAGTQIQKHIGTKGVSLPMQTQGQRFIEDIMGIRKYALLTDLIWGTVNAMTFFWLNAKNNLLHTGFILILAFLVVDVILTLGRFYELYHAFKIQEKKLKDHADLIDQNIKDLEEKINTLSRQEKARQNAEKESEEEQQDREEKENKKELENKLSYLIHTKNQIKQAQSNLVWNWTYQQRKLWLELAYISSMSLSFLTLCAFFITDAAFPILSVTVGGAVAWYLVTFIYDIAKTAIETSQAHAHINLRLQHIQQNLIPAFNKAETESEKKLVYLQIKELLAQSEEEKRMASFAWKKTLIQNFVQAWIPVVLIVAPLFLASNVAWVPILGLIAIILVVHIYLNKEEKKLRLSADELSPGFEKENAFYQKYETEFKALSEKDVITLKDFEGYRDHEMENKFKEEEVNQFFGYETPKPTS